MRTSELIAAIAQDAAAHRPRLGARLAAALLAGGAISWGLYMLELGVRADILLALQGWRFPLKLTVCGLMLAGAYWASARLARPETCARKVAPALVAAPALLAAAVCFELLTLPAADWTGRAVGSNARLCLTAIPLLSAAPLAAILVALRAGAPRSAAGAGAVAGLLAGGAAATLYATHCFDDSPLFVAIWYTLAVAGVALAGAIAGTRVLRW